MTSERPAEEERPTDVVEVESEEQASEPAVEDPDELAQARRERDEYLELAQRTRAELENYRKRVAGEARAAALRGKAELARELIPVIDSLERAIESVEDENEALARGVGLVLEELNATLVRAGVEAYDPTGQPFDPNLHEAMSTQEAQGQTDPGTVLETVDRGYRLDGQVLRPARVVVSK